MVVWTKVDAEEVTRRDQILDRFEGRAIADGSDLFPDLLVQLVERERESYGPRAACGQTDHRGRRVGSSGTKWPSARKERFSNKEGCECSRVGMFPSSMPAGLMTLTVYCL